MSDIAKIRYSKVSRRMWNDEKFRSLSAPQPNAQSLWQRLLTGPELTNIPGLFPAWEAGLAQAMKWSLEGFREAFREVFRKGMVEADWDAGLVWVPNAIEHNRPESPNVVRGWRSSFDELPECALKHQAIRHLRAFVKGLPKAFGEAFTEVFPEPSPNQEQEQEQEQEKTEREIARPALPATPPPAEPRITKSSRGTRLAPGWQPSEATLAAFRDGGYDVGGRVERFVDHWVAVAGAKGVKLDWEATFRNWVRRDIDEGRIPRREDGDDEPEEMTLEAAASKARMKAHVDAKNAARAAEEAELDRQYHAEQAAKRAGAA